MNRIDYGFEQANVPSFDLSFTSTVFDFQTYHAGEAIIRCGDDSMKFPESDIFIQDEQCLL